MQKKNKLLQLNTIITLEPWLPSDASQWINVRILCGLLTLTLTAFSLLSEKARL